ncbi:MAG: hypothetical protein J6U54_07940 [Clostridiales bacterium]|nr:hypothetical protein [Clostridiales bacterium]
MTNFDATQAWLEANINAHYSLLCIAKQRGYTSLIEQDEKNLKDAWALYKEYMESKYHEEL